MGKPDAWKIMETLWLDAVRVTASRLAGKVRPLEITAQNGSAPYRTILGPSMRLFFKHEHAPVVEARAGEIC